MGAAYLLAAAAATVAAALIRDQHRKYRQADTRWRLHHTDQQFARQHRIEP